MSRAVGHYQCDDADLTAALWTLGARPVAPACARYYSADKPRATTEGDLFYFCEPSTGYGPARDAARAWRDEAGTAGDELDALIETIGDDGKRELIKAALAAANMQLIKAAFHNRREVSKLAATAPERAVIQTGDGAAIVPADSKELVEKWNL